MAPHGRKPVDNSLPIEAISRVDGSIWKIELLRQMSATTWFIRWSIDGVDDRSVFDQEMSIDDMRPESMGCHQSACVEGRLREGVRVVAFISLPREHRSDPAVTGKAWYDGVIVKAERASHIHPLPRGGTYGECQCAFTIGFSLETDTTKRRPPTFAMRVCGTRYLAFRSIIDGTVADVIAGRIGRQNFKQSWLPEFLEDVSRYSALPCVNPPRGSFRRNHGVDRNREPERVAMCSAPETPARDSESSAFAWGGEESESVRSGSQVQQPTDPGPSPRREETTETVTGRGSLEGARLQELDDVRAAEINKRLDERIDRYLGKGELTETGAPSQDNEADASSTERRTEADVTLPECRVKGSGVESVRTSDFTWLRRLDENETGREKVTSETRPVGLMGTGNVSLKRKKPAGKNDSTSKRMKREGENENPLLGSREAALPSEDWWATLAAAEERANAAAGRSDGRNETPDPNGVRPRPNDFPGASPPFARSTRQQGADVLVPPKRAKLRGGEKEATAKYVGQQEKAIRNDRVGVSGGGKADKVLGGRGAKQTFAKLVKAKKASVWSDSEDEQSGPSAARGAGIWPSDGDGQDPVATAWEQCALLGRERAMRDALAAGALAREEIARAAEESAGRDCERRAHALRQDGDGVYCTECGCLVRQLTEADVRQPTPATDSKRYLAPHDVAEDDPEPPRKKKKVGTGPVKNKKREPAGDNEAERLESGTVPAEPSGEKFLREQMLPHQVEAFEFLKKRMAGDSETGRSEGGAILWLAPGLGKTLVALALIEHLRYRERLWPLIVTPAAIQENWVLEIQKWFTGKPGKPRRLEIYRVDEPSVNRAAALERREDKLKKRAEWTERAERAERAESGARGVCDARARKIEVETADDAQLDEMRLQTTLTWRAQRDGPLLISFEQLRRTADARAPATRAQAELGRMLLEAPNLVLCDEGQTLRNSRTQTFKVLERFKTARRLMLTGTMFNNNFDELYNLARFVCARDIVNWARQLLQAKPKAQRSFRSRNPFQSPKLQTHAPGRRPTLATPGEAGVLGLAAPRLAGASAQKGVPAVPFQHCGVPAGGSEAERPVARESVRDPFGRQAASPRNSSALGSGPSTPAEGPEPEASFVRELFLKTFQGPIERWVCGSGNRNEESRAEAKAALRELTALMQPFLFYGGEDTLYGGLGIPQRNDYVIRVKMSGKGREVHESFVERVIGRATYEQRIANSRSRRIGNTCQRERPGYDACPAIVKKRFGGQSRKRKSKEQDVFGWDESSGMNGEESDESEEEERGECAPSAGKGAIGQEKDMMHLCAHPAAYFRKTDGNRTGVVPGLDRFRSYFLGPVEPADSPKLQLVIDLLRACKASGEKTLVFSYYTKPLEVFIDGVKTVLGWSDREIAYIHGGVPFPERMKLVESFQSGDGPRVLFATLGACGLGLNLQSATRAVVLEPPWNPTLITQAFHRAVRIGQKRPVVTYRLICADTYEDRAIHRASLEKDCLGSVIARAFERCARAKTGRARADAESARAETGGARGEAESARGETGCTRGGAEGARAEARTEEHVGFGGSVPDKTGYLFRACNLDKVTAGDRITDPFLVGFLEKWGEELVVEACEYRRLVSEQAGL